MSAVLLTGAAARGQEPRRSLADLVDKADAEKIVDPLRFSLPQVSEAALAENGLRKIVGQHVVLYTDMPSQPAIEELPAVFDAAVPQWAAYFGIDPAKTTKWRVAMCLVQDRMRFSNAGLWPDDLPKFLHGYAQGSMCWIYVQPSEYYVRHLLLHEGTHSFMNAYFESLGPPWFAEGVAELLGTHRWSEGKLEMGIVPRSREESALWGRIRIVRDQWRKNAALSLPQVMAFPGEAFRETDPYAWAWSAALFFDHDPERRDAFRQLRNSVRDVSPGFSERLWNRLPQPRQVQEEWQWFIANLDYGYDVAREKIVRREAETMPAAGANITIAVDRGWQSSGLKLPAGHTYRISAEGRFQIARTSQPWPCEADGVTIRYHRGEPLGKLLAAVTDEGQSGMASPLVKPQAIGSRGEIRVEREGVLYFRINDSPAELADNEGELKIAIQIAK